MEYSGEYINIFGVKIIQIGFSAIYSDERNNFLDFFQTLTFSLMMTDLIFSLA